MNLPLSEMAAFRMTVIEAQDLAVDGEIGDGYRCLQGGLARAVEAQEGGEPWGED